YSAFLYSFFFYSSVYLRALHSFPTRRSSDLFFSTPVPSEVISPVPVMTTLRFKTVPSARGSALLVRIDVVDRVADGLDVLCFFVDRKSTRLNSSHDQISYAVFCLKKKNIKVT